MQKWATYRQYFMPTGALDNIKLFEHLKPDLQKANCLLGKRPAVPTKQRDTTLVLMFDD